MIPQCIATQNICMINIPESDDVIHQYLYLDIASYITYHNVSQYCSISRYHIDIESCIAYIL